MSGGWKGTNALWSSDDPRTATAKAAAAKVVEEAYPHKLRIPLLINKEPLKAGAELLVYRPKGGKRAKGREQRRPEFQHGPPWGLVVAAMGGGGQHWKKQGGGQKCPKCGFYNDIGLKEISCEKRSTNTTTRFWSGLGNPLDARGQDRKMRVGNCF